MNILVVITGYKIVTTKSYDRLYCFPAIALYTYAAIAAPITGATINTHSCGNAKGLSAKIA
jgi:hypothetical protein